MFQDKARHLIHEYLHINNRTVLFEDIKLVWFNKTLQHWKALVADLNPEGMYYEVTYNGDKKEAYIDAYKKFENVCVKDVD